MHDGQTWLDIMLYLLCITLNAVLSLLCVYVLCFPHRLLIVDISFVYGALLSPPTKKTVHCMFNFLFYKVKKQ